MKITIYSNFLNHHQKPLADELRFILGDQFHFVSSTPTPKEFISNGYTNYEGVEYNICSYKSERGKKLAEELMVKSDVVVVSSVDRAIIEKRIKHNKLTFLNSEHLFKRNRWEQLNPKALYYLLRFHSIYRNKNLFLLCSSAHIAKEMSLVLAYPSKKYKWGYFTKVGDIPIREIIQRKSENKKIKLLWVGRMITWKHPELAIKLASLMRSENLDFSLKLIGNGPLKKKLRKMVHESNLNAFVSITDALENGRILEIMRYSDILLFTSDYNEGWGAVANEAMSSGCVVVASDEIGCVPYLIENKRTGLIFKNNNIESLHKQITFAVKNPGIRELISIKAHDFIKTYWSPRNAAKNLITLSESLLHNKPHNIYMGPGTKA